MGLTEEQVRLHITGDADVGGATRKAERDVGRFADRSVRDVKRVGSAFSALRGLILAAGAAQGIKSLFEPAIETEQFETQMAVILGSTKAAKERIAELQEFAATTPFQLPGIVRASRTLETMTKGALSSGAGLRMVGDAAAGSGEPVEQLAVHVGRLYSSIMSGRSAGESLMRLQELGIISGETRNEIERLQKANADSERVWRIVTDAMGTYEGMMKRMSDTVGGKLSTLKDNWARLKISLVEDSLPAINEALQDLIDLLGELKDSKIRIALSNEAKDAIADLTFVLRIMTDLVNLYEKGLGDDDLANMGDVFRSAVPGGWLRDVRKAYEAGQAEKNGVDAVTGAASGVEPPGGGAGGEDGDEDDEEDPEAIAKRLAKLRERAARTLQDAAEDELDRRRDIEKQIREAEADLAKARERQEADAYRRLLRQEETNAKALVEKLLKSGRDAAAAKREADAMAKDAWDRALNPEAAAADDAAAAREEAEKDRIRRRSQARIDRGATRGEDGVWRDKRGRKLRQGLQAEMEAVWAEQQAGAAGQAELDAQAKLEAAQAALKEATSHLGDVTDSNTDAVTSLTTRIGELRDELADGADLDGVDLGGLTDEQLESIAAAGRGVLESTQEYIDQHTATLRMLAGALGLPGMPPDPGPAAPFDLDREMALAAKLDRTNELLVAINDAIAGGGLFL